MKGFKYLTTMLLFTFVFFSCDEDEWLEETVYDFYSTENSYTTYDQFDAAVTYLYWQADKYTVRSGAAGMYIFQYTTDISYDANSVYHELNSYADAVVPDNGRIKTFWKNWYQIIYNANVVLDRIDGEDTEFDSEEDRTTLKAEAHFFRAFAYRMLAIQFGGVPLVLEEITTVRRDFVRSTLDETLAQIVEDLEYAAENLPDVNDLDASRLPNAAAYHLLSEIYIMQKDYDSAIEAASEVIDSGDFALMTERFGARVDEDGDVFWDLFRDGNLNRSSYGNTESIWVAQSEYDTDGEMWTYMSGYLTPRYWSLTGLDDGEDLFLGPMDIYAGRGIGWLVPTDYMLYTIWEDDSTDMRCSEYNIMYDITANNPASEYYGKYVVADSICDLDMNNSLNYFGRKWTAINTKVTTIGNYPDEYYTDLETGVLNSSSMASYQDIYQFRLAETYLLRAEAYWRDGQSDEAADDINVVRARAGAELIDGADVDEDYILDERARELNFEEFRSLTLARMGRVDDRLPIYNPMYNGTFSSNGVSDYHNLYPIPQTEIENNTEAVLEQNPGY
jgi:hypothetical protein